MKYPRKTLHPPFQIMLLKALFFILIFCASTVGLAQTFDLVWTPIDSINAALSESVKVYQTKTPNPNGSPFTAFYAIVDASDDNIRFKAALSDGARLTPRTFSTNEEDEVYVAINAGFFGGDNSFSLVLDEGQELVPNIRALNRPFNGVNTPYYPTRGAFAIKNTGQPDVAWVYSVSGQPKPFAYPNPSPNALNTAPQPVPSATFPEGGSLWEVATAVGGSPVLVQNGQIRVTATEELINVNNNGREPRTAIGYTADQKVILLVVDGRSPAVSVGASLPELAQIMIELGAVEAMNLDGGGSSAMVVNDLLLNVPSDGNMRAVPSAFLVMQKRKTFDTENTNTYVEVNSEWLETANSGFYGESKARYKSPGDGSSYVAYSFKDLSPAEYEVTAWWVPSSNRSTETPYIIAKDGLPNDTIRVNQAASSGANQFNLIGTFHLGPKDSLFVSDLVSDGGLVTVDAIQVKKVAESKPSLTFAGASAGNFIRGEKLQISLTAQSPNSGIKLQRLAISVSDGINPEQELADLDIDGLNYVNNFDFELNSPSDQLIYTFRLTDEKGREVIKTFIANLRSFTITFSPNLDVLDVVTNQEVVLDISAVLPASATSHFSTLTLFKKNGEEEVQVGDATPLSGTTMSEQVTYKVVDRANQSVTLRLEITTNEGEKGDRSIVLKTSPAKGDLRIAVISDFNGSFGNVNYEKRVTDLIARMPNYSPDLVICGGDMIAGQSTSLSSAQVDAMWAGFETAVAGPLRAANIPFAFTMGNHDAALTIDREAAKKYWEVDDHFPRYFPIDTTHYPFYQSFMEKENGDLFMVSWDATDANISSDELAWVREQLESTAAKNAKYRFIIGHLPLYAVAAERNGSGNVLSNADALLEMMEAMDVHTYFSGHHHAYYPAKRGAVDLMNAGATGPGERQLLGTNDEAFNSFTLIDLFAEEDTLIYNTFKLPDALPDVLPIVEETMLPEIIEGFNGFLIRRDLNTTVNGRGNLSAVHLGKVDVSGSGIVETTHLPNNQLEIVGNYENLTSDLSNEPNAIAIYQGQHASNGSLAFEVTVSPITSTSGTFTTTIELDAATRDLFAAGAYYVLIKTSDYPEGALRTQIYAKTNHAPSAAKFETQKETDTLLIRDNQGVFRVKWEEVRDPERNPVTYIYQLSLDDKFENLLVNAPTGRTNFYQLITEGMLVEFLEGAKEGTFYHRVIVSDGSHITTSETTAFIVEVTEDPADVPIQILAPAYRYNADFQVFTTASNGHGIAVDKNNRIWHGAFGSGSGFRVTNPNGTPYRLNSQALQYSNDDLPAVTSLTYGNKTVPVENIRGMGADEEGFILIINENSDIYCFDPDSGEPVAFWEGNTSFTNPTVDTQGRVFVASVTGNKQYLLEREGSEYKVILGQEQDFLLAGRALSRSAALSKDGKWMVLPASSGNKIHVYNSADGVSFEPYEVIESVSQGGCNSITAGENGQFWYLTNRSSIPPMLVYRDFEKGLSWSLPLDEIESPDQRGLAFSNDRKNFYTISAADGSIANYRLPNNGMSAIPTYTADQIATRNNAGVIDSLGVYARVVGKVFSSNYSDRGVDISFGGNEKGLAALRATSKQTIGLGDSVVVVGEISENSGLITIRYDSLRSFASNSDIEYETVTTISADLESRPVKLEDISLKNPSNWGSLMEGFEVLTINEVRLYVDVRSAAFMLSAPQESFGVYGVVRKSRVNPSEWALWLDGLSDETLTVKRLKTTFTFSPNPVTAESGYKLSVYSKRLTERKIAYEMTDLSGKEVKIKADQINKHEVSFDLYELPKAVYLLKITIGTESVTQRVIR
ncbi:MAG: phosphodiester glycosidase family protein [Cyclobacteriaceae bacterium]